MLILEKIWKLVQKSNHIHPKLIGITKKKKWSLRKGMELCRSKNEISYVKRDRYKLVRPQTSKKKKLVVQKV